MLIMNNLLLVGGEDKSKTSELLVRLLVMLGVLASTGRI